MALATVTNWYAWGFFLYPSELEWRESTNWLHALALSRGVNVFEFTQHVYVNANHGIVDHILKAGVFRLFPSLSSSEVLRVFVPFLPSLLTLTAFFSANVGRPFADRVFNAIILGLTAYILLQSIGFWAAATGRSDATAYVLIVGALLVAGRLPLKSFSAFRLVLFSFFISLVFFTNWRFAPICAALPFLAIRQASSSSCSALGRYLLFQLAVASILLVVFVYFWFDGGFHLFLGYFFGFFLGPSGFSAYSSITFSKLILVCLSEPSVIVLFLLQGIVSVHSFALYRDSSPHGSAAVIASSATFIALAASLVVLSRNFYSGGLWYLSPMVLLYLSYGINYSKCRLLFAVALSVLVSLSLFFSPRFDHIEYYSRSVHASRQEALNYMRKIEAIDRLIGVTSDELHLFKRDGDLPSVDMGDVAQAIAASGSLGASLTGKFAEYESSLRRDPPSAILLGLVPSTVLKELATSEKYVVVIKGPPPLMNGALYVRKDLLHRVSGVVQVSELHTAKP